MSTSNRNDASREERLLDVIAAYVEARDQGQVTDRLQWLARYPEFAAELADFFATRERLEGLAAPRTGAVARPPAGSSETAVAPALPELGQLGDFHLLREVGRGGMGVVYEAEQISLCRRVALKLLPFVAALDPKQLQRFKNEAQAAAHLQHTNIVPVFYVGCERGVHFYAMQYIDGQTLAAVIRELRQLAGLELASSAPAPQAASAVASELASGRWVPVKQPGGEVVRSCGGVESTGPYRPTTSPPHHPTTSPPHHPTTPPPHDPTPPVAALSTERSTTSRAFFRTVAHLGVQAAEALEHAHQLGIIHRDIKPANLLVDAGGRLWVADFGLAHCQSQPGLTMTGDLVGTLRYMSPEQALAKRVNVDARTDVYSLGVTLYELLTLEPAYNGRNREEVLRQITFDEPRPPRRLNKAVPAELETIVLKAMGKNPDERYASAQELADDLRRFLEDKPIRAKRPSLWQRAVKWARRHKTVVRAAVVVLLLAVVGLAASTALIWQAKDALEQAKDALERNLYFSRIGLAHSLLTSNPANPARAEELLEACPPDRRGWEWQYLKRLWRVEPVVLRDPGNKEVSGLAFSPDGELLAAACLDHTIKVWHLKTGEVVTLRGHEKYVYSLAFSPTNGRRLASASADKTVRLWDLTTRQEVRRFPGSEGIEYGMANSVTFSPDGRWLAAASEEGTVRVWDAASGEVRHKLPDHDNTASCVAFSPDGQLLASGNWYGIVQIWDAQTGRLLHTLGDHVHPVGGLAFSPDGGRLALGYFDRLIDVWDPKTGKRLDRLAGHTGLVLGVAFSPDGSRLASTSEDRTVRIWDLPTGQEILLLRGHTDWCQGLAFNPDGRLLASSSKDGTIRLWDATPLTGNEGQEVLTFREHTHEVWNVAISPDGKQIAAGGLGPKVHVWDAATGQVTRTFSEMNGVVFSVAFSPDGQRLAAAGEGVGPKPWVVKVWDVQTSQGLLTHRESREIFSIVFSPDSRWLALGVQNGSVKLWDMRTGAKIGLVGKHDGEVRGLTFRHDGQRLASASRDGTVKVWDVTRAWLPVNGLWTLGGCTASAPLSAAVHLQLAFWMESNGPQPVLTLPRSDTGFWGVAYSPDGRRLLTVSADGQLTLWEAETGHEINHVGGQFSGQGQGLSAAFSPDGRWVASAAEDCTVKVGDATTLDWIHSFRGHMAPSPALAFTPDGRRLVSASQDATLKVWDLTHLDRKPK